MISSRDRIGVFPALSFAFALVLISVAAAPAASYSAVFELPGDSLAAKGDTTAHRGIVEAPRKDAVPRVCITLEKGGTIVMELLPEEAPLAVERVLTLVREGFYDGLKFHRVESFLVQTGKREHDYPPLIGEMFSQNVLHEAGMVGMARLPGGYDTATTQFYIIKQYRAGLNGEYTLFARVTEGMDVVNGIKKGDKIETVRIVE